MALYPWNRFWLKRGSILHADYHQFPIYYPSGSPYFDQNAFQSAELEDLPLLVLLGEPGIGKSVVIEQAFTSNKNSYKLYSRLSKHTSAKDIVEEWENNQIFKQWQRSTEPLYLYIDGLDEGILYTTTIGATLLDWLEGQPVSRIFLRITCRTAVWEKVLEDGLVQLYRKILLGDKPLVYELGPLSRQDVSTAAREEGIEAEAFLQAVTQRELAGMASKPITLSFLLRLFKDGTLLQEQLGKTDIYYKGCLQLCTENSRTRRMARKAGILTKENRLRLASRLAAYTVFSNKPFLAKESTETGVPGECISPAEVIPDYFQMTERTETMDLAAYNEVLDTGLFIALNEELLGWSHRTFAEFLAAWHVYQVQSPLSQLQQLFFSTADEEEKVTPQLEETAAWLASMHKEFFVLLMQKQPIILLRADGPVLSDDNRRRLIESLLEKAEAGQMHPFRNQERYYSRLKHERLAEQLATTLTDRTKSVTSRCLAAEIGRACACNQLSETLVQIIIDPSEDIWLRREAMNALEQLPELTGLLPKFVPLVLAPLPDDHDDEFKAALLRLLFPKHLTTHQLLTVLTKPKDDRLIGEYKAFLNNLDEKVPDESVADVLSFLAKLDEVYNRYEHSEFGRLLQGMIKLAWQLVEQPAVLNNLTLIILRMYENHQTFFIPDNDDQKRRLVAWQVLMRMDGDRLYLLRFARSYPGEPNTLVNQSDWEWLTELLVTTDDAVLRTRVAQLLGQLYTKDNTNWTDQVIILAERYPEMRQAFASWLETVDLDSPRGMHLIKSYLEERKWRERAVREERKHKLRYSPLDEARNKLQQSTLGDNEAWWRMLYYLSIEETDSGAYTVENIQPDIRQYPLWPQLTREEQG